ncbi:Protein NRT1/ PTR FAMILY 5.7 [Capsicum annuum]|uniref:Protein NRT1/ PTR FAMILY 5.7 n=1 Tax=Capsicum annuum TaxID=4072 RepID=A0A1U8FEF1_CAPAN|nr:protein NRT1/ PTR FAMILY 5.6 [Capsicum annuum]KAF3622009.1 Protein NRT1/ PTR FAMILY 5.7 [Capsicum annuum]KAF3662804.1 Protein NRT1/ PTR FAMILY 5.7 [Capsicum annuum]PHT72273.1 Protein NRT1/ PTR FAMILY 5.7 [Capsicum annuum]
MEKNVEMDEIKMNKATEIDEQKWVYDSSVDYKGRVPLRASTGGWKASFLIIAIEFSERLSYFGIATSLIIYLTKVIHQDLKTAAKSVNYWTGVTTLMPLLGGFVADAYLGRFYTVLASTIVYLLGLVLLAMSTVVPSLKSCGSYPCQEPRKVHVVIFFFAIYLISIGTGGHRPSLESFGADQFDDDHPQEKRKKMSFFNWWSFGLCSGVLLGVTLIVYVQDHVSWAAADLILTLVMASSLIIFCSGRRFYRYRKVSESPLTTMLQVLVASIKKRNLPHPSSPAYLHETQKSETNRRRLCHTKGLKFLDKAAIFDEIQDSIDQKQNPWRLATVTKVEELKLLINMIPIWLTTLPFGVSIAQASTFFIKQGVTLNRKITDDFEIPPASMYGLGAIGMIATVTIYEKILVRILRQSTGNERGISILQRIGIGMIFSIATMIIAALVERKRLRIVQENLLEGSMSMSVFWLTPQFLIVGIGDGFALVGLQEYFYDQVPDTMRSLGIALYLSVIGAASFLSSILITIVDHVTEKGGKSWFGKDINSSRLDYFYFLLATLTTVNLCIYILVARRYSYKNVQIRRTADVANCYDGDDRETMA